MKYAIPNTWMCSVERLGENEPPSRVRAKAKAGGKNRCVMQRGPKSRQSPTCIENNVAVGCVIFGGCF